MAMSQEERLRKSYKKHKVKITERARVRKLASYGVTPEQYQDLFIKQQGVCGICKEKERRTHKSGKVFDLAVDHDHVTGVVRGLLCGACNTSLGLLRENEDILLSAIQYLRRNKK